MSLFDLNDDILGNKMRLLDLNDDILGIIEEEVENIRNYDFEKTQQILDLIQKDGVNESNVGEANDELKKLIKALPIFYYNLPLHKNSPGFPDRSLKPWLDESVRGIKIDYSEQNWERIDKYMKAKRFMEDIEKQLERKVRYRVPWSGGGQKKSKTSIKYKRSTKKPKRTKKVPRVVRKSKRRSKKKSKKFKSKKKSR